MQFIIPSDLLIQATKFASTEKLRPWLAWVLVNFDEETKQITLASTDSYRLHEIKTKGLQSIFPQYQSFFLSDETKKFQVNHLTLIESCKHAKLINKAKPAIKLWKSLQVRGDDEKWYDIPSSYNNDHEDIIINADFLLEILKQVPKKEKVYFMVSTPTSPLQIEWTDTKHIIMPLKK